MGIVSRWTALVSNRSWRWKIGVRLEHRFQGLWDRRHARGCRGRPMSHCQQAFDQHGLLIVHTALGHLPTQGLLDPQKAHLLPRCAEFGTLSVAPCAGSRCTPRHAPAPASTADRARHICSQQATTSSSTFRPNFVALYRSQPRCLFHKFTASSPWCFLGAPRSSVASGAGLEPGAPRRSLAQDLRNGHLGHEALFLPRNPLSSCSYRENTL